MKRPIKLFKSDATNFNTCKNILSECLSATITENIDGNFCLDLEYPIADSKGISKLISRGTIIKCPCYDNRPDQLFKVRKISKSTNNKKISVYAEAIARAEFDRNMILGIRIPPGTTRKNAIEMILNSMQDKRRIYKVGNKDTSTNTNINLGFDEKGNIINYLDIAYVSPLKALLDESENSIYKAYGGEIEFNNFEINMFDERGKDNKFTIRSGKNLSDLEEEISDMDDDFATALIMCSSDGLYLPNNEILYSSYANQYDRYFYKVINCDDVNFEDLVDENSTTQDIERAKQVVYEQLRERGKNYFNKLNDRLFGTYKINFVELAKSEEYKDYAQLTNCSIGNTVKTIYKAIGITVENRITEIKYNVLTDKIEEITVGKPIVHNIAAQINSVQSTATMAKFTAKEADTNIKKKSKKLKKDIEDAIEKAEEDNNNLKVVMKKRATEIELSVTNEAEQRKTQIMVLDGKIEDCVKNGEFGSKITQHYNEIVQAIEDATGRHTCTFNGSGLHIQNGGISIENNDGDKVLYADSGGNLVLQNIYAKDIGLDSDSAWNFWNTISKMELSFAKEIRFNDTVTVDGVDSIYIREEGRNLKKSIEAIIKNMVKSDSLR